MAILTRADAIKRVRGLRFKAQLAGSAERQKLLGEADSFISDLSLTENEIVNAVFEPVPELRDECQEISAARIENNIEKEGIEIYFQERPADAICQKLKTEGFRWNKLKKCWYRKRTPEVEKTARLIVNMANDII